MPCGFGACFLILLSVFLCSFLHVPPHCILYTSFLPTFALLLISPFIMFLCTTRLISFSLPASLLSFPNSLFLSSPLSLSLCLSLSLSLSVSLSLFLCLSLCLSLSLSLSLCLSLSFSGLKEIS